MDLLISVKDTDAPFLVELLKKFDFVKIKKANDVTLFNSLERSFSQMQEMRNGKTPKPSISELFTTEV